MTDRFPAALHGLVGIHRVQAGRVETSQPNVAHAHELKRVIGVLEPVRQLAALVVFAAGTQLIYHWNLEKQYLT